MALDNLVPDSSEDRNQSSTEQTPDEEVMQAGASDDREIVSREVTETEQIYTIQIDYSIERDGDDEYPVIHVFGRDENDELQHVKVYNFQPYFYTEKKAYEPSALGQDEFKRKEEGYESIRGDELERIETVTPRGTGQIRDDFEHYEADILFPNRFLIDKDISSGVEFPARENENGVYVVDSSEIEPVDNDGEPRIQYVDIEVDDRNGFPEDGEEEIICITAFDSFDQTYVIWLYEPPTGFQDEKDAIDRYEWAGEETDVDLRRFENEDSMMYDYLEWTNQMDADIVTGWYSNDFDVPYILDRLEVLDEMSDYGLDNERLSRINEVWRGGWGPPDVKGRVMFDLMEAYEMTKFSELDSKKLDDVAEDELGIGKKHHTERVGDLWTDDSQTLIEYNLRDVELLVELDRQNEIIPFWDVVRTFAGCKLEDTIKTGDMVDVYVLHKTHGRFVLPSKGQQETEEFEGGAVFDPVSGVLDNISVLDLKSLYPMCMVTINASPETKVSEDYDGETYRSPNGVHYKKDEDGIVREMVDELLGERERLKEKRNQYSPGSTEYDKFDRQQAAVKVIMNSLYGVLGWKQFRLYDKDNASSVTATGRSCIDFTGEMVEDEGYTVAYGDTDSVMIELGEDKTMQECVSESYRIVELINQAYDEFAREELNAQDHRFQMEFEKLYRKFFQAGKKKRYAGHIVWKEGKETDDLDVTGFESERSDIPYIVREAQSEILEMAVKGEGEEEIREYIRDVHESFKEGEYSLEDIAKPSGLGKHLDEYETEDVHVIGSKVANMLFGTNIGKGDKPKRVILESYPTDYIEQVRNERGFSDEEERTLKKLRKRFRASNSKDPAVCFEREEQIPDEFEIDYEAMIESNLRGPIERVIEPIGIGWSETIANQKQAGLAQW